MKIKQVSLLASIISASLLLSGQANAAAENAGEFYLGAKTGWADFDFCETGDCDDDAWGGSVYGGYQFNTWLSLEGGYNYLGKSKSYTDAGLENETEVQNGELGLKLDWNLGSAWNLFGKVGTSYNYVDATTADDSGSDENWSLMAGAGLEYQISHNWRLRTEYQWFDDVGEKNTTGQSDINYVSLGLTYYFGEDKNAAAAAAAAAATTAAVQEPEPAPAPVEPEPEPLPDAVLSTGAFELNSTALNDSAKQTLTPVASYLNDNPDVSVDVIGYTDSSGAADYNQQLSEKRAQSAADYLVSEGVDASRINVEGQGENNPIADNSTLDGRIKNRRIEISYQD